MTCKEKIQQIKDNKAKQKEDACILDSGERRTFQTGAVRDIQEGKGRCDLLPLETISSFLADKDDAAASIFRCLGKYQNTGDKVHLIDALQLFGGFGTIPNKLLEISKHFEDGAKKYGENNWQKGIPTHCYIDSAVRHYLKYMRFDTDERHDRAFCWNLMCAIWTCENKPELNDYAKQTDGSAS